MPSRKSPCVVEMGVEAVRARGRGEGGEIDMGGEVGLAGIGQHVLVAMLAQGLQRVADAGCRWP